MRHRKSGRPLNRNSSHRAAMFRNMMVSLFKKEIIKITVPKAKELRRFAEPMITLAKKDTLAGRRLAFDRLRDRTAVANLFEFLGKRYATRNGGYLRILKCDPRPGDKAPMAYVELIGQAERKAELIKEREEKAKTKAKSKPKKKTKAAKEEAPKEKEEL